jgi:tetratricopeptide (TPR) repeat protein
MGLALSTDQTLMSTNSESPLTGNLKQVPLFSLFRRIQLARRSGTLRVTRNGEQRHFWFEDGELRAARSSKREHSLGASLIQWGYIAAADLERALELQRRRGGRLGALLVELGLVPRSVVDTEVRRLMEQIVSSAISWSDAHFDFEPRADDTSAEDIQIDLSVTAMIVEGIRRVPECEKFLGLLGDLGRVPRIPAGASPNGAHLPAEASAILALVDGRRDVREILALLPGSRLANSKIFFTLAYCGFLELASAAAAADTARESAVPIAPERPGPAARDHRSLVLSTYRRIDWLSDYDLLGVSAEAGLPEIEDAYQRAAVLFDPALRNRADLADCGRQLTILWQRASEAYHTLSDPQRRAVYDGKARQAQTLLARATKAQTSDPSAKLPSEEVRRSTAELNYRRAVELIGGEDVYPAIEMLEEAVRFVPDDPRYQALLGRSKLRNRWWQDEAIEHLEEAVRLEPRDSETRAALAEAYLQQGEPTLALPHARMALNVAPPEQKEQYRQLERRADAALAAPPRRQRASLKRSA